MWPLNSQLGFLSSHSSSLKSMKCNSASVKDVVLLQWQKLSVCQQRVSQPFILSSMKDAGVLLPIRLKFCVARERPLLITRQYSSKMSRFPISQLNKNTQLKGSRSCLGVKLGSAKLQRAAASLRLKKSKWTPEGDESENALRLFRFTVTSHKKKLLHMN